MRLPRRVKVLGKTYPVLRGPKVDRFLSKRGWSGSVSVADQQIRVRLDLHPDVAAETLLHEVVHVVDHVLFGDCLSETRTRALSAALFQVLQDNGWWGRR